MKSNNNLNLIVIEPSGFCAGVSRAIEIVENAIEIFGTPVYVNHEIVHNKFVLDNLKKKGAVFVSDIKSVPDSSIIIFNAHGVSLEIEKIAKQKNLNIIDATCPLVSKVHRIAGKLEKNNIEIILIGHKNHPETIGTKGRVNKKIHIIENEPQAIAFKPESNKEYSIISQTTLSVDDCKNIMEILNLKLKKNFNNNNVCYATTNRQNAVKQTIENYNIDCLLVIGSNNSSNSNRLKEIGSQYNIDSLLIDEPSTINEFIFNKYYNIAISAGASAPKELIDQIINNIKFYYNTNIIFNTIQKENIKFELPKKVRL